MVTMCSIDVIVTTIIMIIIVIITVIVIVIITIMSAIVKMLPGGLLHLVVLLGLADLEFPKIKFKKIQDERTSEGVLFQYVCKH